ncbi:E3 ubiquitin-protein ligase DTX3L1 isoform X2 [Echeneis naucrates]|nr:E3 ubiquitin-protein ligase DTX3L-like isoform X2 [Echeneis naucrates]XP_029384978.1 E3 ubiquitin-protein ligase DTX3L-like isoform X2 [Echeneis naucrates]XP_029384979.1 E3 ubiquitin-protein ligase DTX3L-like isoform X2 [Echeneis naucrates]
MNGVDSVKKSCQPHGQMTWVILNRDLPGFPDDNTIQINYIFKDGVQSEVHPHPGQSYSGMRLCAFLPDSREGRKVLKLLEKAFNQQLLFTFTTDTNGRDVITASVPFKTQQDGGNKIDGYPDSDYLKTVRMLLKDKGIE